MKDTSIPVKIESINYGLDGNAIWVKVDGGVIIYHREDGPACVNGNFCACYNDGLMWKMSIIKNFNGNVGMLYVV